MKQTVLTLFLFSLSVSIFAQTDEINISASFAQSIELRVIGSSSINFSFSTITDYTNGKHTGGPTTGFEVASSTSFSVELACSPFTNAEGDELDISNLTYQVLAEPSVFAEKDQKWDIGTPDYLRENWRYRVDDDMYQFGYFKGATSAKTIISPGPNGNAGDFEDNRFYLWLHLGYHIHMNELGQPNLLDQNISPGTYTCTMTLTAIPEAL